MMFQTIRETVVQTCRRLADCGHLAGTGGNVALRADTSHLAVTPSATDYYTMTATDICIVRVTDLQQVHGERSSSVETGLHAGVLRARPDCHASIHTHQPIASAYTLLARPLIVESLQHQQLLGRQIPCAGYAPSGTSWLANRVARSLQPNIHAYLMRNHGVVCVGADVDLAIQRVAALETACAEFFDHQLTANSQILPQRLVQTVRAILRNSQADERSEENS